MGVRYDDNGKQTILLLSANPIDAARVAADEEARKIFDRKLVPFGAGRRVGYVLARGVVGLLGFVVVFWTGLVLGGDGLHASDWIFIAAAIPLAPVVFALVVPAGGKPILAGYLGWSGASRDWRADGAEPAGDRPRPPPRQT